MKAEISLLPTEYTSFTEGGPCAMESDCCLDMFLKSTMFQSHKYIFCFVNYAG